MSDVIKIRVSVRTDKVGSECQEVVEFAREDWEGMTEEQREAELRDAVWDMAEWNWEQI